MAVVLSTNKILPLHNDQPSMNVLIHVYQYPFLQLGEKLFHLAHIKEEDIVFENNSFKINKILTVAIHYHGKHRECVKSKIIENYDPKNYEHL